MGQLPRFARNRAKENPAKEDKLTQDFVAWRKEYNQWLKTSGRNHSGLSELIQIK